MDSATNFMSETLNNVLSMDKIEEGEKEGEKEYERADNLYDVYFYYVLLMELVA